MANLKFKDENGNWISIPALKGEKGDQGPQGQTGVGLPAGGVTNQILVKSSNVDYDYSWVNIVDMVYPVGSIYISLNNVSPEILFGGTWVLVAQGKTLIGAGTGTDVNGVEKTFNIGDEVGEYEHTLTVDEMPSHSHRNKSAIRVTSNSAGVYVPGLSTTGFDIIETGLAGGGKAHNNTQPGFVCYIWQRTA